MSSDALEFHAPSPEELQPFFPAYEVTGYIAQGGMGAVYAARQISLDRPVAIKILPTQFGADPQFRASFEAEAKSMARLNHPNLIGVYDFGDADGMLYIIMELVEGKSLHHSAHGKAIEQSEAARLVAGVSHGLAHAHQHGILHRDIKPGNILLGPGAVPKIGDFGLARPLGEGHRPDEIVWGTPGYSAPEVVNKPDSVDQRADIFAIGVLLYELLTAKIPSEPWTPPSSICNCSPEFDAIIRRATHPSPEMRYKDAAELAAQLDKLVEKLKKPVLRRPASTPAAASTPGSPPVGVRPGSPALAGSPSKATPIVVTVLLIALAAVAAIVISGNKKDQKTTREPAVEEPAPKVTPDPTPRKPPRESPKVVKNEPTERPRSKPGPKPEVTPTPEPAESTTQTLARLRTKLMAGDLGELPKGTAKRGESHFLLLPQPMSWVAASHFAEDHGAQLATLESADDLGWAIKQFKMTGPAWLGVSDSGMEGKWFWVTGQPVEKALWAQGQPDDTDSRDDGEDFAALLPDSTLDDLAASRKLPVLLQWTKGGNPGSLEQQLRRVAGSLEAKRPVFPAGTRNVGGSRFLFVPRSVSWEEADLRAQAAGGHLAVPSSDAEASWITSSAQRLLGGGDGCWIGGRRGGPTNPQWAFVTGEKFEFVAWAPDQPDEGEDPQPALQIWRGVDGSFGYNNAVSNADQANYFLIEWSAPSRRNMPAQGEGKGPANAADWLAKYREDFARREKVDYERWKRRHEKNVEDFADDIESEAETSSRVSRVIKKFVDDFTDDVRKNGEVPASMGNPMAERFLGRIHGRARDKQEKIWTDYLIDFEAARERYLAAMESEIERRKSQGDRIGVGFLTRETAAVADDKYFLDILSGEAPEVPEEEEEDEEEDKDD